MVFKVIKFEAVLLLTFFSNDIYFLNNLRIPFFILECLHLFNPKKSIIAYQIFVFLGGFIVSLFLVLFFINFLMVDFQIKTFGMEIIKQGRNLYLFLI